MKILYAIQGTGNGHLSRARDIIPLLQQKGELDILVSGIQADVSLPYPVKYAFKGLSFIFGKKGGIDLIETYKKSHIRTLLAEIDSLPVQDYDLILNDFEPVSAWACRMKDKVCVSLSHQAAVLNKKAPQPKHFDIIGRTLLKNYAPSTAKYGFHFMAYDSNIFTPVIRKQIRDLRPENKGHYTVYLPAYSDKRIIKVLSSSGDTRWEVFSKHNTKAFREKDIWVRPISNEAFIESLSTAEGVLCGAGFETPAEALFLKKKLMVIPMKNQYEQYCNAAALHQMGVPVLKSLQKKHADKLQQWLSSGLRIKVDYPDATAHLIDRIFAIHCGSSIKSVRPGNKAFSVKKFRELTLRKMTEGI